MEGIIYLVINQINGNCYIGKTIKSLSMRKMNHISHAKRGCTYYFHRALRKYGEENFKWIILAKANSENKLNQLEKSYIKGLKKTKKLYNLTDGGEGTSGRIKSPEERNKLSIANKGQIPWIKGKHLTDEHKKKLSESKKGKNTQTPEQKRLMAIGYMKGKKHTKETKKKLSEINTGENNHFYGKKHTEESKRKMSESSRNMSPENRKKIADAHPIGFHLSSETKKKLSEANKDRKHTDETIEKMSEAHKGHKVSKETRRKIAEANRGNKNMLGYKHTNESKRKMSEAKKGGIPWNKGTSHSEETKRKISESIKLYYDNKKREKAA